MIGVVVATHGSLASGIGSALALLTGKPEKFEIAELHPGMGPDDYIESLRNAIDSVDDGDGVLVLLDIFGGTPSNVTCRLLAEKNIYAVAGVSLPMAIDAVFGRQEESILQALGERVATTGSDSIVDVNKKLAAAAEQEDEGDF